MMFVKPFVLIYCFMMTVLASEKYTDKYDNINIKEILETKRLLIAYFNCIMERGNCTPEGKELKNNLIDALETGCEKCTQFQMDGATTVIEHLIEHEREMWNELCAKFDPDGKWRKTYEERAKEKGIVIPTD